MNTPRRAGRTAHMARALALAAQAAGRTAPNPMVGAVVVREGRVVGEGYHSRAGEPHAEVLALAAAGAEAQGADLYVTLEPCCHFGRTPPCTDAIVRAGVKRVFAAHEDPNPKVAGRGVAALREAGVAVSLGLLREEAATLNEVYLTHITLERPHVTLKVAMSLDGKSATRTRDSRWITSEESRLKVHEMRNAADAVLVGIGTVLADDPELTTRLPGADCRNPHRVILDSLLRTPQHARVLGHRDHARTILVTTSKASPERVRLIEGLGAEVIVAEGPDRRIDLAAMCAALYRAGITSLLVEGGGEIAASCLEAGIVDRLVFFVAPLIIGGREALPAVGGKGVALLREAVRLRGVRYTPVGPDLMVQGCLDVKGRTCSPD